MPGVPAVAVAFSGGRDSLALLHITCRAAALLGLQVVALHVHHGLQAEADDWVRQAQALVRRWRRRGWPLSLRIERLEGRPAAGESVEAWARAGRRAALARMAHACGASLLLLGQHRRDQAETVLLQLLRGAGSRGLAAMPMQVRRAGLVWARPWLAVPRPAVDAYVRRHRLKPVEDPSNRDTRWARNHLRLGVWPALQSAFPQAEAALALSAQRAAEEGAVLQELAAAELARCTDAAGRLDLAAWRLFSAPRQAWLLRHWWRWRTGRGAPESLVQRLLAEATDAPAAIAPRAGRAQPPRQWPPVSGQQAVAWRGWLDVRAAPDPAAAQPQRGGEPARRDAVPLAFPNGPATGAHAGPGWPQQLWLEVIDRQGLSAETLAGAQWRPRAGGERFQPAPLAQPVRLKKAWQLAGVPAWARDVPLLWGREGLLFVPGLGVDGRHLAPPGVLQYALAWRSEPTDCAQGPG